MDVAQVPTSFYSNEPKLNEAKAPGTMFASTSAPLPGVSMIANAGVLYLATPMMNSSLDLNSPETLILRYGGERAVSEDRAIDILFSTFRTWRESGRFDAIERSLNLFQREAEALDLVALLTALTETQTIKARIQKRSAYRAWLSARITRLDSAERARRLTQFL